MPQIKSIVFQEGAYNPQGMALVTAAITRLNDLGFRFRDWHNPPGVIILEYTDAPFDEAEKMPGWCWMCRDSEEVEYGYPTMDMAAAIVQQGKGNSWDGGMPSTYADYARTPITDEQAASMPNAVLE